MNPTNDLSVDAGRDLLALLEKRFADHPARHPGLGWSEVAQRLQAFPSSLGSLKMMEESGGEPDVVKSEASTEALLFFDCASESPAGRRSCCYDEAARLGRKKAAPENSAEALAAKMGIELLTEKQYHQLQQLGEFDRKTSSWLNTPAGVRDQGGAIFGDRRFGRVFVYHNGADSYYAARGFRGVLHIG